MSYRRNDSESESSSFDPGDYSTNRRRSSKSRRRGSAKIKGACRGDDGKFVPCDDRCARPNDGARANTREDDIADRRRGRKSKSARKASKRSSWGGCKGGYSKSYSTKGGRKSRKSKGGYKKASKASGSRRTKWGGTTSRGRADLSRADKDLRKAASLIRGAKHKVTGTPRGALEEILHLLKSALDT